VVDVLAPRNAVPTQNAIVRNVHAVPGLDLIPCDERGEALDTQLRAEPMGEYKLTDALKAVSERYDRIFMDCPPNIGELTVSALLAADEVICPVNMGDINAVRGLSRLTQTVEHLNRRGAHIAFKSLIKVNSGDRENRFRINNDALERLAARLELRVARTELRSRAAWGTAVTQDLPLILLEESDRGTREAQSDVHHLVRELWPTTDFLYPSEIKSERKHAAEPRKAAA
jgi:chromosome partitioning protein